MYTYSKWRERIRNRIDISTYLVHLTRSKTGGHSEFPLSALDVLIKILNEKTLKASEKGFINGGEKVVCFQDSPLYGVSQNVKHEMLNRKELGDKIRYEPVGICLPKHHVFQKGGRPVIYEKPEIINGQKTFPGISKDQLWRTVSLDLTDSNRFVDWTHEREWRIKGNLEFELDSVYVVLADAYMYADFIKKVDNEVLQNIRGVLVLEGILY